jgi:hypothetical protein
MTPRHEVIPSLDETAVHWLAARRRNAWPHVRIDSVLLEPCGTGRRVRAVVQLGGLTPADVHVGLLPAATADPLAKALATDAARSCADRMWSAESYGNGVVVFERVIAAAEEAATDSWVVYVTPVDVPGGRPLLYPLRLGR